MVQRVKIIDVTKSFVVVDPNYFPENQGYTQNEDTPEKMPPILSYEGYNFLPTVYGYRSYFGLNSTLNITALTSRVDRVLVLQKDTYQNILVALCEDGMWTTTPSIASSAWTKVSARTVPTVGTHKNWSFCIIENTFYAYREGETNVDKITYAGVVSVFVPTFLNMAGQKGIFRAGGRLGFWDSANSVSWSDLAVLSDFTPSVTTRAGNATFNGVRGRIVNILQQGDGFVIYTTKGIVGVRFTNDIALIWEANTVSDTAGIAYPFQVTTGITDIEHYAFTNTGIKKLGAFNALAKSHQFEEVLTDTYDLLKESNSPVYLDFMNGRYLILSVIDNTYIDGRVSFSYHTIDTVTNRVLQNNGAWTGAYTTPLNVVGIVGLVYTPRSVAASIATNMSAGVLENDILWWNSTIATVCPVPPPDMTAAIPYTIDASTYQHVPNTPIYIGVTFNSKNAVPYTDAAALTTLTGTDVLASVSYVNGGAKMWGTLAASLGQKGVPDEFMIEAFSAQTAEWANFATIQAANKVAIEAIPNKVNTTVVGGTAYASSALAQTAIDVLVAAGGGTGSTHQVGADVLVGSFLDGGGTLAAPVVTTPPSIGFNNYSLTRTFLGGWDVKKRTVRTYSIRAGVSTVSMYQATLNDPNGSIIVASDFPYTPTVKLSLTSYYEAWIQILAAAPNFTGRFVASPGFTYNFSNPQASPDTPGTVTGIFYDLFQTIPGPGGAAGTAQAFGVGLAMVNSLPYYIDYFDTVSIVVTANPTITADSTFTAQQLNLRWAYIAQGEPLGSFTSLLGSLTIPGSGINGSSVLPPYANVTTPGATFLMDNGSIAPIYPTFVGAFVLDTALKKWGKFKADFKTLFDMAPVNATGPTVSYTNFGVAMSMMDAAGAIKIFDTNPATSWIRYGKMGYSRLGFTKAQEIRVHFRSSSTGNVILDSSLDGRALEPTMTIPFPFTTAASIEVGCYNVGRWHTITVSGNWDLQYMEFRANSAGRR